MFKSVFNDIKTSFDYGNMVVKLIIINVAVYMVTAVIQAFAPQFFQNILPYIALPGEPVLILFRPWTLITHMFLHGGLWHLIWNMLTFYWFGNIAGDLLGEKRILPVYILGGLVGAVFFIISYQFLPGIGSLALGASAAVLSIVFTAVATAPDYIIKLVIFGDVRIKFIGLFILFFDILGVNATSNSGGHIAHLGGTLFGFAFVYLLRSGTDLSNYFNWVINIFSGKNKLKTTKKSNLKISHKASNFKIKAENNKTEKKEIESRVDEILEKIKQQGYENLTNEEKEILFQASKN